MQTVKSKIVDQTRTTAVINGGLHLHSALALCIMHAFVAAYGVDTSLFASPGADYNQHDEHDRADRNILYTASTMNGATKAKMNLNLSSGLGVSA